MKQRREKVLQNAKDRKLAKANPLIALQASVNSASNDTQSITNTDDVVISDDNTDNAAIDAENTDNAAIDAENTDNAAIDADNTDNAAIDADKTDNATSDREKTDDATTSDYNMDNTAKGDGNTDNTIIGEASRVHISLPPCYGGKANDPSQIKTSTKCTPAIVEPSTGDPLPDNHAAVKASGHTADLTDVHIYEFLIQGTPNPHDLEGIEEDQLLQIQ